MITTTPRGRFGVRRTGAHGRPVVLLHPLAMAGEIWDPMAHRLAADRRVLATDARGHGESDWDGADFTIEDLAEDTASIIESVADEPVDVVGLSMGGSTAIVLAASRPELVRRLVLADTTACYGPGRVAKWAERAENAVRKPREQQLTFQLERWFSERFRQESPAEVDRVAAIFLRTNSAAHAAACRAFGAMDSTDRLAEIGAGTLVLVGAEDYATPPVMAERIAKEIPGAEFHVLANTRHFSLVERPELWPVVTEHLAD